MWKSVAGLGPFTSLPHDLGVYSVLLTLGGLTLGGTVPWGKYVMLKKFWNQSGRKDKQWSQLCDDEYLCVEWPLWMFNRKWKDEKLALLPVLFYQAMFLSSYQNDLKTVCFVTVSKSE